MPMYQCYKPEATDPDSVLFCAVQVRGKICGVLIVVVFHFPAVCKADSTVDRLGLRQKCSEEIKKARIVRFPPLGGCREGFHSQTYSPEMKYKPLPATTKSSRTPPRGGN